MKILLFARLVFLRFEFLLVVFTIFHIAVLSRNVVSTMVWSHQHHHNIIIGIGIIIIIIIIIMMSIRINYIIKYYSYTHKFPVLVLYFIHFLRIGFYSQCVLRILS